MLSTPLPIRVSPPLAIPIRVPLSRPVVSAIPPSALLAAVSTPAPTPIPATASDVLPASSSIAICPFTVLAVGPAIPGRIPLAAHIAQIKQHLFVALAVARSEGCAGGRFRQLSVAILSGRSTLGTAAAALVWWRAPACTLVYPVIVQF